MEAQGCRHTKATIGEKPDEWDTWSICNHQKAIFPILCSRCRNSEPHNALLRHSKQQDMAVIKDGPHKGALLQNRQYTTDVRILKESVQIDWHRMGCKCNQVQKDKPHKK